MLKFFLFLLYCQVAFGSAIKSIAKLKGAATAIKNRVGHLWEPRSETDWTGLTQAMCRGTAKPKLFSDVNNLFAEASSGGTITCPSSLDGSKKRADFIAPTKDDCDINWARDSKVSKGGAQCYPEGVTQSNIEKTDWGKYAGQAPAILGFGSAITALCGGTKEQGNESIENCCMKKDKMYNRLWFNGNTDKHWTFCKNMKWVFCAAQGFLPGQKTHAKGGTIVLAAVSNAANWGAQFRGKSDDTYKTVSVTLHETCLLDRICKNSASMFSTPPGKPFDCEYDGSALKAARRAETETQVGEPMSYRDEVPGQMKPLPSPRVQLDEDEVRSIATQPKTDLPYLALSGAMVVAVLGALIYRKMCSPKEEEAYSLLAEDDL